MWSDEIIAKIRGPTVGFKISRTANAIEVVSLDIRVIPLESRIRIVNPRKVA
jgi:3D (Asp-Asp-Asp) domain-containing protein